jgi:hypothetical protein
MIWKIICVFLLFIIATIGGAIANAINHPEFDAYGYYLYGFIIGGLLITILLLG